MEEAASFILEPNFEAAFETTSHRIKSIAGGLMRTISPSTKDVMRNARIFEMYENIIRLSKQARISPLMERSEINEQILQQLKEIMEIRE